MILLKPLRTVLVACMSALEICEQSYDTCYPSAANHFLRMGGVIHVFHSTVYVSLCFEFFLQNLWRAEVLQGVSLQSCSVFLSSFLLHSYFYSLGFWIFQASNSCFSLFEHFSQILPFPNLWFHSKLFHNWGHDFGMTIFPKHCSAAQKHGAVPSKAGFCLKVVTRWFSSPCEYVRIWEVPCFLYVNIHYKTFKYLLLVAHTIKMQQCVMSSQMTTSCLRKPCAKFIQCEQCVCIMLTSTPQVFLSVTGIPAVLIDRHPSEEYTVSVPQHKQKAFTYSVVARLLKTGGKKSC